MSLLLAASNAKALWYLTRGTGVVSLVLLTAVLVLGVVGTTRWRSERWPRFLVAGLHRNLTLFAIAFVVVHVVTTVADGFAPIRLVDAVVPFISVYRPIWLGLGALAFDLLLALTFTSLLRARVGLRLWRAVHWLAYAAWPLALVHGLGTGSDSRLSWLTILTLCCAAAVALAVVVRLLRANASPGLRVAAGVGTVAVAALVFGWYRSGPAQPGWAARAGTPTSILRRNTTSASPVAVSTTMPSSFEGKLTGRLARNADGAGNVGIAIGGNVTGGAVEGVLKVTLWGAESDGGVAMTDSSVTFQPVGVASGSYTGQVVGLDGNLVQADVTNSAGQTVRLTINLQIDSATGAVTGTVHGA
jgi:methionine sulfoxide reductase heme-binding subunit